MMKVLLGVLLFAVAVSALAPLHKAPRFREFVADEYLVILQKGLPVQARDLHIKDLQKAFGSTSNGDNRIGRAFHIGDFIGFHAKLSPEMIERERAHPEVRYIDYNGIARISDTCFTQRNAVWGLDRINEVAINLDGHYNYGANGSNVDAYIIDTGILVTHDEFKGGRATWGLDAVGEAPLNQDCNGHGTHVAGTVGGHTYGVAKGVHLIAVKVLDCDGSGSYAGVIEGIEWVADQGKSTMAASGKRSVANMSLGGGFSSAINDAVESAIAAGVVFAVAAGNENTDACDTSPASAHDAITVGATSLADISGRQEDERASFSNYGTCLDIFAPGEEITSAWIGSNDAILTISGTSMASPHVAGAAAVLLSSNNRLTPAEVESALGSASTKSVIDLDCPSPRSVCNNSPNAMLYTHCDS